MKDVLQSLSKSKMRSDCWGYVAIVSYNLKGKTVVVSKLHLEANSEYQNQQDESEKFVLY